MADGYHEMYVNSMQNSFVPLAWSTKLDDAAHHSLPGTDLVCEDLAAVAYPDHDTAGSAGKWFVGRWARTGFYDCSVSGPTLY